ncbi:Uncharacterised protein [Vibrio cholerae]|uniref:Uncharacterized protein n=1 Tax=Vibrio cholerae TaxID=666 RepID=A0A655WQ33_VIBCL|nr:Uncharacterised protein [Vibrio cholerae]CSB95113.1 Uncharacterised protein [Vibrio cholerae]
MRFMYTGPLTGSPETSEVAVISPIASSAVIRKIRTRGINSDQSKPKPYCIGIGRAMNWVSAKLSVLTMPIRYAIT